MSWRLRWRYFRGDNVLGKTFTNMNSALHFAQTAQTKKNSTYRDIEPWSRLHVILCRLVCNPELIGKINWNHYLVCLRSKNKAEIDMAHYGKCLLAGVSTIYLAYVGAALAMPFHLSAPMQTRSEIAHQNVSGHVPGLFRRYHQNERDAAKRRHPKLPRKHIEHCNRLVSAYRQSDNTIAYDRYTRVQCFSPYYKPY